MWTHRPPIPICSGMAHRLLLTLLALLTGLAAQISPAEACASPAPAAQVFAVFERTTVKAPRAPVALAQLPEPGLRNTRRHAPQQVGAVASVAVATVFTGIDRARE